MPTIQALCAHCKHSPPVPTLDGLCDPCFGLLRIKPLTDEFNRAEQIMRTARLNRDQQLARLREARQVYGQLVLRTKVNGKPIDSLDVKTQMRCHFCRKTFADAFVFASHEPQCEAEGWRDTRPAKRSANEPKTPKQPVRQREVFKEI